MTYEHCHSGGEQHGRAYNRGSFGWLCWECWVSVCRILKRDPGSEPENDSGPAPFDAEPGTPPTRGR